MVKDLLGNSYSDYLDAELEFNPRSEWIRRQGANASFVVKIPKLEPNTEYQVAPEVKKEIKDPRFPQLKTISSYCNPLQHPLVSMESENTEGRNNLPSLTKINSLGRISDIPLMLSQGDSAFALLNSGNEVGESKLWGSKGVSWQGDRRLAQTRPEMDSYVSEPSSLIANIVATTYFSKQRANLPTKKE